jgi:hypothetical protein
MRLHISAEPPVRHAAGDYMRYSHSTSWLILFQGGSLKTSPERYLRNSGLRTVGSSHGVSNTLNEEIRTTTIVWTHCRPRAYTE